MLDLIGSILTSLLILFIMEKAVKLFVKPKVPEEGLYGKSPSYIHGYTGIILAFRFNPDADLSRLMRIVSSDDASESQSSEWIAGASQAINDIATGFSGPVKED